IPNVLTVNIMGAREEVLEIILDGAELESYNISSAELINAVTYNNMLVPAGEIDTGKGRFTVKLPGLIEDTQDLLNMPLKSTSETVVRLGDVATVHRSFKDADTVTLVDGKQAMSIEVSKRGGSNMIDVADQVIALLAEESIPGGINIVTLFDSTPFA